MDYLTTREPEEIMPLSAYKKHAKRQGAELLCNTTRGGGGVAPTVDDTRADEHVILSFLQL